jgi:hypothetical protein
MMLKKIILLFIYCFIFLNPYYTYSLEDNCKVVKKRVNGIVEFRFVKINNSNIYTKNINYSILRIDSLNYNFFPYSEENYGLFYNEGCKIKNAEKWADFNYVSRKRHSINNDDYYSETRSVNGYYTINSRQIYQSNTERDTLIICFKIKCTCNFYEINGNVKGIILHSVHRLKPIGDNTAVRKGYKKTEFNKISLHYL